MNSFAALILVLITTASANVVLASSVTLASSARQVTLIELYTSEGCSSCPPADRWLSTFRNDAHLWRAVVPVAFHVDYWNGLGWRDRFSESRFSKRQQNYKDHGHLSFVYTPGVLSNGREWRGWRHGSLLSRAGQVGLLRAVIQETTAKVDFEPIQRYRSPLVLNIAILGFGLSSRVEAGENEGKLLTHDFVVLDFRKDRPAPGGGIHWEVHDLPTNDGQGIALWVSEADDPTPIQATGGWLQ